MAFSAIARRSAPERNNLRTFRTNGLCSFRGVSETDHLHLKVRGLRNSYASRQHSYYMHTIVGALVSDRRSPGSVSQSLFEELISAATIVGKRTRGSAGDEL